MMRPYEVVASEVESQSKADSAPHPFHGAAPSH